MAQFKIEIIATGGHGCERKARTGERLYGRCGKFGCPDCMAFDFIQQLRMKGSTVQSATFSHQVGTEHEVVDDMLTNTRKQGQF